MAQGKLKVKAKLPPNVKIASVHRGIQKKKAKVSKKSKSLTPNQKLQNEVTKEINKNIEAEARGMASKFGVSAKIDCKI